MNLLQLNVHWVANVGALLVAAALGINADGIPEALTEVLGPGPERKVMAWVRLLGLLGGAMAYLGKPKTVKPA